MPKIKTWLGRICTTAALVSLSLVGLTVPAHAENTYPHIEICNSIRSRGIIEVIDLVNSTGGGYRTPGTCGFYYNADNRVRVDPDPENVNPYDVDSTWWGYEGQGLDYCDPGEGRIDPPNYYIGYIKYNTDASGC